MSLTLPTSSGYSGFWQLTGDYLPYYMTPRSQQGGRSPIERQLARLFKRNELRELVEAMLTLNGATAGSTAAASYSRVQAVTGPSQTVPLVTNIDDFGGNRSIETVAVINRATTAADKAYVDDLLDNSLITAGITYPTRLGSGGEAYKGNQGIAGFSM